MNFECIKHQVWHAYFDLFHNPVHDVLEANVVLVEIDQIGSCRLISSLNLFLEVRFVLLTNLVSFREILKYLFGFLWDMFQSYKISKSSD